MSRHTVTASPRSRTLAAMLFVAIAEPVPDDAARIGICLACHSAESLNHQPRLDKAQWLRLIEKMRNDFGAPIAPGQVEEMATYLSTRER